MAPVSLSRAHGINLVVPQGFGVRILRQLVQCEPNGRLNRRAGLTGDGLVSLGGCSHKAERDLYLK